MKSKSFGFYFCIERLKHTSVLYMPMFLIVNARMMAMSTTNPISIVLKDYTGSWGSLLHSS